MARLEDLSWNQLVEELRALSEHAPDHAQTAPESGSDPRTILHNLLVHQVELEMQNRELRDAQQRLEASRARYADLYDFAPVGCLTIDCEERIQEINLTGAALLGRERAEIVGRPFLGLVPLGEKAMGFHVHLRHCLEGRCRADMEIEYVPKGRAAMLLHMTSSPILDASGRAVGCRTALTDVTDRRRAESAEADSRMKEEFLGTLSHELRTPLAAMKGWVQLLQTRLAQEHTLDPHFLGRGLAVIARNAALQARLVEDLLDVSRILAGKLRVELRPTDLESLVQVAAESFRLEAEAKGVAFSVSLAPRAIVSGDAQRITQVLTNLFNNALKFTPPRGAIEIRMTTEPDFVRIAVRDTGRGIAKNDLPRIFARFAQVDSSTTRAAGGLGLGLAIVDSIVRAHGGEVRASSPGLGLGATFAVRLRRISGADGGDVAFEPEASDSLEGRRVLCVDDDADTLDLMAVVLRARGAQVSTARSAAEALGALTASTPDVVVSDIGLPGRDGYALIQEIRALPGAIACVPAIAVTAYSGTTSEQRAREAGFQRVLSKPIAPEAFARAVASVGRTSA